MTLANPQGCHIIRFTPYLTEVKSAPLIQDQHKVVLSVAALLILINFRVVKLDFTPEIHVDCYPKWRYV